MCVVCVDLACCAYRCCCGCCFLSIASYLVAFDLFFVFSTFKRRCWVFWLFMLYHHVQCTMYLIQTHAQAHTISSRYETSTAEKRPNSRVAYKFTHTHLHTYTAYAINSVDRRLCMPSDFANTKPCHSDNRKDMWTTTWTATTSATTTTTRKRNGTQAIDFFLSFALFQNP